MVGEIVGVEKRWIICWGLGTREEGRYLVLNEGISVRFKMAVKLVRVFLVVFFRV